MNQLSDLLGEFRTGMVLSRIDPSVQVTGPPPPRVDVVCSVITVVILLT